MSSYIVRCGALTDSSQIIQTWQPRASDRMPGRCSSSHVGNCMSNSSQSINTMSTGMRSAPHAELLKHLSGSSEKLCVSSHNRTSKQ